MLISGDDEIPLDARSRDAAGPLLRSVAAGETAAGVLRFTLPAGITQRLSASLGARLRIANRTIVIKLTPSAATSAPNTTTTP